MIKQGLLIALLLGLSACSVVPTSQTPKGTDTLLAQADQSVASGNNRQAIAILERAVRLQPRNAQAWVRLAELYLLEGEYRKAEQFAGRAQQIAPDDRTLQRRCNAIQQEAREKQQQRG